MHRASPSRALALSLAFFLGACSSQPAPPPSVAVPEPPPLESAHAAPSAAPAKGDKTAECNAFIDAANEGQAAFSQLDALGPGGVASTVGAVDESNGKLERLKFSDTRLDALRRNYVAKIEVVVGVLKKADTAAKAVESAVERSDVSGAEAQVKELEKLKGEIDGAIREASQAIDDVNAYCSPGGSG